MNLDDLTREAPAHLPHGWAFSFSGARRQWGRCDYAARTIYVSAYLAGLGTPEEVRAVLLHEVAHALTPGCGHGPAWRVACMAMGIDPVVRPPLPNGAQGVWQGTCQACGAAHHLWRRPTRPHRCCLCGRGRVAWVDSRATAR
jgi:hypothetical protein